MKQISFEEEEQWDKKKIGMLVIALVLIAVGVWYGVKTLDKKGFVKGILKQGTQVLGANHQRTTPTPAGNIEIPNSTSIKTTLQDKINSIKNEVSGINATEIASTSPQVQKALSDLKNLENYPGDQARVACENICKGL